MKTLLILLLAAALLAGATLSRPSKANFEAYIKAQAQPASDKSITDVLKGVAGSVTTDLYLRQIVYHDRYLWVTVEHDGQTQYVGAFNHWFANGSPAPAKPTLP